MTDFMAEIDAELAAARAGGFCAACGRRENIDPGKAFCEDCDEESRVLLNDFIRDELEDGR